MRREWTTRTWRVLAALSLIVIAGLASVPYAQAATTVTLGNGDVAGLANAVLAANGGIPQVINLYSGGMYVLSDALPPISGDVTIHGNGATISPAAGLHISVMNVSSTGSLSLENVTITGGNIYTSGAGLYNNGTLTIADSTVFGNSTTNTGGGIYNSGTLKVLGSTITSNNASYGGGGIYTVGGTLTVSNSTISNNIARGGYSVVGGGIGVLGGNATVLSSTVADNGAGWGGGVAASTNGTVSLTNSIVANNYANLGPDAYHAGGAYNLIGVGDSYTWLTNGSNANLVGTSGNPIDPLLGPLADNGGPTQTMALQTGSPAIGAGNITVCSTAPVNGVDQRGYTRPVSSCDIGAFELDAAAPAATTSPALTVDQSSVTVDEGQAAANTGTVTDPNNDLASLSASVGTVENNGNGTWSWSFETTDGPSQSQTVTISADYGSGGTISTTFILVVNNVAPTVGAISDPPNSFAVGTVVNLGANFTDPGTADTHTASWDWGDGSTSAGTVTESDGSGSVNGTHTYTVAGLYTVTLKVTDKDHATAQSTYQYLAIYDPTGGFITGGGWINSPAGAYFADPSVTGKVSFGFVAKYHKGADVPAGNLQLQFKSAGLSYHSESYQWLIVSGTTAQAVGTGSLNGMSGYGFTLTVGTGQGHGKAKAADTFRIEITDPNGNVVYDNGTNTALGGGSIVIHK